MRRLLASLLLCAPALAMEQYRLPTIPPEQYSEAQRRAAADFLAARKTPVFGPFEPLMYSAEVMSLARAIAARRFSRVSIAEGVPPASSVVADRRSASPQRV